MTFNTEQLVNFIRMWDSLPSLNREAGKRTRLPVSSQDARFAVIVEAGHPVKFFKIYEEDNHAGGIQRTSIPDTVRWTLDANTIMKVKAELAKSKRILDEQYRQLFSFKSALEVFG